jgi:hypothetical protein
VFVAYITSLKPFILLAIYKPSEGRGVAKCLRTFKCTIPVLLWRGCVVKQEKDTGAAGIEILLDNTPAQSCTCQFCGSQMKQSERLVVCSVCETPHHESCYAENSRCTTYACKGSKPFSAKFRNGRIEKDLRYSVSAWNVYKVLDEIRCKVCPEIPADVGELIRDEGLVSVISEKEYFVMESEASMRHQVREEVDSGRRQAAAYKREISRLEQRQFWIDLFSFKIFNKHFAIHFGDEDRSPMEKQIDDLSSKHAILCDRLRPREAELRRLNALNDEVGKYKQTNIGYARLTDAGTKTLEAMGAERCKLDINYNDFRVFVSPLSFGRT